ncbi:hypothetical protein PAECIP111802_07066 [Paenibacillus allorhizosphaerae]|uniref:Uncharacterized protein n=1 Tax=Paenibacillus allorhizosphaerae TaxID=2849866 RepID=A0ABN7TWI3_9BACL|nr:hypothetical protein PAECIP111802_07066 [Paenibacillus allorhizosphaerae]
MWARIFHRIGQRLGRLTIWGVLILIIFIGLLIVGIYSLLG